MIDLEGFPQRKSIQLYFGRNWDVQVGIFLEGNGIVLKAVGLPLEGIGMLLSIDWFLDRLRTSINVWGDSIGAAVVDTLEQKYVEEDGSG